MALRLTDALLGEHAVLYTLFGQIEAVAATTANLAWIQQTTVVLGAVVRSHAKLEEELLFPALEPHLGIDGPLAVMRAEHEEFTRTLQRVADTSDIDDGTDCLARALDLVRDHFQKEEQVLFSLARQMLDDETQMRLGNAWAEARRVTIA
jgi:hemerythrin-like domain-containing protein